MRRIGILAGILLATACASTPPEEEVERAAGSYTLVFEGATRARSELERAISVELSEFVESDFAKWAVDDAAFALESHYLSLGYDTAQVDYALETGEGGRPRVRLIVREGEASRVVAAEFEGATVFPTETLVGALGLTERPYVESEVGGGLSRVQRLYRSRGYVDVRAETTALERDENGGVTLQVAVREGPLVSIGDVHVEWVAEPAFEALTRAVAGAAGEPFVPGATWDLATRLREALGELGYAKAVVETAEQRRAGEPVVDITLRVDPGPELRIAEIEVVNAGSTREAFVRSRLGFEVGDLFTPKVERQTFRDLFRTGLFSGVTIRAKAIEGGGARVVVELEERSSRELFVEPGYGSYEELRVRFGLRERNLFGDGILWRATTSLSDLAQAAEIGIGRSGVFGLDPSVEGDLAVFAERREEPSFTSEELGARATLAWRYSEVATARLEYQYLATSVEDVAVTEPDLDISSVVVGHVRDVRDHVFLPTRGSRTQASLEVADSALGSDIDFLRAFVNASAYVPLGSDDVLALAWRAGAIFPSSDGPDVPIQELFFNGGENTVRSFREDELGPVDGMGDPVGGEGYHVLTAEWRRAVGDRTGLALFVDVGNLVPNAEDIFEFDDLEVGIGLGFRYLLPIGPVRFDVAWNPSAAGDQDEIVTHLAVGMPF